MNDLTENTESSQNIFIARDNQKYGPYNLDEVKAYLTSGQILITDQALIEGAKEWIPVSEIPGVVPSGSKIPPPSASAASSGADEHQQQISAKPQKNRLAPTMVAIIVVLFCFWAIMYPVFQRNKENARETACQSNLQQIAVAIQMYTQDYDNKFPPFAISDKSDSSMFYSYGWADALQPYAKSTQLFKCPSANDIDYTEDPTSPGYTDYWFNPMFSKIASAQVDIPPQVVMMGDGSGGTSRYIYDGCHAFNPRESSFRDKDHEYQSSCTSKGAIAYPSQDVGGTSKPLSRHLDDGANYIFADGHVKWLMYNPEEYPIYNSITPGSETNGRSTFNPLYGDDASSLPTPPVP